MDPSVYAIGQRTSVTTKAAPVVAALLLGFLTSSQGGAQTSSCGWTLSDRSEPDVLLAVERAAPTAPERIAALVHQGFAHFRRWIHDCNSTESRLAIRAFERANRALPSDPALKAALGIALARGTEVYPRTAQGHNYRTAYVASNAERQARRLLSEAIEKWPLPELGEEIAALALSTRSEASLSLAETALQRLTDRSPDVARLWTVRAEVAIGRREFDEAKEFGQRAARMRDAAGLRALGVARLLSDPDPSQGGRLYLDGITLNDQRTIERYREDLTPLLSAHEEEAWRALVPADRAVWLAQNWEWRASVAGRTVPERLAIHFRRLDTADQQYRRMAQRGAPPTEALVWGQAERSSPWDDRGLIFIRHGEPDEVIRAASGDGTLPKEAWIYYAMNGAPAVFEFRKAPLWADYVAALPVECGVAQANGDVRPDPRGLATFQRVILDYGTRLAAADPDAATRAYRCYNALARGKLSEELPYIRLSEASSALEARRALTAALQTETAGRRFASPLSILASAYALKGADSGTTISTFFQLPAEALTPAPMYQGVTYPLQVSLAVEDQAARSVQRVDTLVRHNASAPLLGGQHVRTVVHIPARPAADATVRLTVSNTYEPAEGQSLAFRRSVPTFATGAFALSDLIVAESGNHGYWTRGNVSLSPVPGHRIAGRAFRLYYEIYGLSDNESVRTRMVLSPTHEDGLKSGLRAILGERSVQELEFDERTVPNADGIASVDRMITTTLDLGRYVLELTIQRSSTGERLSTSTEIILIDPHPAREVP